jgi:ATP-binding cassette subfamily B protein
VKKVFSYFRFYWWQLILLVGLTYLQVMATLKLPDYMAKIVNLGIIGQDMGIIWQNGWLMLAVTLGGGICAIGAGYLGSIIAAGFSQKLRRGVFSKVEGFALNEFNKFSTASLITRSTNDIQQVQTVLIMVFRLVLMAPIMAIGALQSAIATAPGLTWIIALAVGITFLLIGIVFAVGLPKFQLLQKMVDKLNMVTRENLTGLRVVRAFNNEAFEESKFDGVNKELTAVNLFVNRIMVLMMPAMMFLMNLAVLAIIWFGAHLVQTGGLEIGNMMAFMQYSMQVIMSFLMMSMIFIIFPRGWVSLKRLGEVLNTDASICDPVNPVENFECHGVVEFRDVTFSYPGADLPVLTDINFTAKPGETTAFIGSTGSGKSTLINLLPRFYDVTAGQILLDGVDVRKLRLRDLYHNLGYVPQRGILFSGDIRGNIGYGDNGGDDANIARAAEVSQSMEFIDGLPEGLGAPVSQGGSNVSGGQKQRLSIARALARNPKVYIFDDSFSALDFKTDRELRTALEGVTKESTVLLVAQRIGTIMGADQIIVLDEGKIVGKGKHQELLETCEVYREIAQSQLSDEELADIKRGADEAKQTESSSSSKGGAL